jgi:3-hydroxyacyl-[acyl-carrier-protein] dehydratase
MPALTFDEVRKLLPQSYPMVLIDVVETLDPGQSILCKKNVTGTEWMFAGHFPDRAIFPGVLMLEAMAQAAIILFKSGEMTQAHLTSSSTFLLVGAKSRFLKPVVPGDQVRLSCQLIKAISTGGVVEAKAMVEQEVVATADLTFAVRA